MSPPPVGFSATITEAGLLQLPSALVQLVLAPLVGILIVKVGMKRPMVVGMLVLMGGYLFFYYMLETPAIYDRLHLMLGVSIISIGMVLAMVGTINMVLASTPREYTGISTGMNSLFRMTGGVIGPVVAGVLMTDLATEIPVDPVHHIFVSVPSLAAYEYIVLIAAAAAVVSAVVLLFTEDIFLSREGRGGPGNKGSG